MRAGETRGESIPPKEIQVCIVPTPTPEDPPRTLGIDLRQGPRFAFLYTRGTPVHPASGFRGRRGGGGRGGAGKAVSGASWQGSGWRSESRRQCPYLTQCIDQLALASRISI